MNSNNDFRQRLVITANHAIETLIQGLSDEDIYAISLYTSGEYDYRYVCFSANSEQGLHEKAEIYDEENPQYAGESGLKLLRWSVPDWKYHNFSPEVEALHLPGGEGARRDTSIYRDFIHCMKKLQKSEIVKGMNSKPILLVTCGDMSEDFFLKGLKRLNPADVVERYLEEYSATPYLSWLRSLPSEKRSEIVTNLYRDLSLDAPTAIALDARSRNMDIYSLNSIFYDLGADGVSRLLNLIEAYGFSPIFNEKGSKASKKFGAFTPESSLATSAVFLIEECGEATESQIQRLQKILAKRVARDKDLSITSTLAENIARVLYHLREDQFPKPNLNPKTNHLDNPEPFLPR